jgi:hypothetical protein
MDKTIEIKKLNDKGVWVLDVAEAENLLLVPEIITIMANHMGK